MMPLTVNILFKGIFPTIHLDELYAAQDLVHQPHALVSHGHTLFAEVRRQSRCEHLQRQEQRK